MLPRQTTSRERAGKRQRGLEGEKRKRTGRKPSEEKSNIGTFLATSHWKEYTIMEDFEVAVSQGKLADAVSSVLAKPLNFFKSTILHIAVVGEPGSGKSSFINAMLGLSPDDPGAAETGISATTVEVKDYAYLKLPEVNLWDLPGKGLSPLGEDIFAKKVDLNRFDFFIIVGSQRFRSTHADLVHEIQKMRKSFYFVRAKADLDLSASKRQRPSDYDEKKILLRIKEDCRDGLISERVRDPQVFIVSSWDPNLFDFPLLQETLKNDLLRLKRQAFLLHFSAICSPVLETKKTTAKEKFWTRHLCLLVAAAGPIPFFPVMFLFRKFRSRCYQDFGLDDQSLAALAQCVGKTAASLKAVMQSLAIASAVLWGLPDLVGASVITVEYYRWEHFPIFGCLLSGGISLLRTYFMLQKCISGVADDTQRVLTKALEAEEKKSV
ncbi:interferon-inducible GTPase 5-like [Rhineura floridana]|uniref:interferon-inducible GTPase 5-like n=1 Tax=Rhineura floridana TaxID=261503 RepID=UPI002AC83F47|nr:interferon-inducible GTPase 5-like [Rhineura floridana]